MFKKFKIRFEVNCICQFFHRSQIISVQIDEIDTYFINSLCVTIYNKQEKIISLKSEFTVKVKPTQRK